MHTFGFPVHLDELIQICGKWKIPIVEDVANRLGVYIKGKPVGSFEKFRWLFPLTEIKIITAGGGGAITTKIPY